ncbi:MAG: aminotransferase class I/II-fold pyridoxal phosphate-dependent enzyme [Ruminococcus sp.]|jgi:histidinol-phosphate aminotransferase|nr:aminotransferase class I/II-fold pyridoxal phosphate-dependent enzyme [Ruminococcus sp.]
MYELNRKLRKIEGYDPAAGTSKIVLDANESPFNINDTFREEIAEGVGKLALNRYPDPYATEAVKAFAKFYNVPESFVTAGNGSDELISIITSCFLEKGDKILTLSPDFSMYAFYGKLYETNVTVMQKDDIYNTFSVGKVIEHCNNNDIKAVIFSNPCNPTSLGIKREEIIRLIKNVFCLVIIDEAYMDFWTESILPDIAQFDNVIVLKTLSKALGAAGIRLGFAVAGETITGALRAAKSPYNTDLLSQEIGRIVLSHPETAKENINYIVTAREKLQEELVKLSDRYPCLDKVYDSVTNFVFIKTSKGLEIYEKLLTRGISIRYMGIYIRITSGTEEENAEFIDALKDILAQICEAE